MLLHASTIYPFYFWVQLSSAHQTKSLWSNLRHEGVNPRWFAAGPPLRVLLLKHAIKIIICLCICWSGDVLSFWWRTCVKIWSSGCMINILLKSKWINLVLFICVFASPPSFLMPDDMNFFQTNETPLHDGIKISSDAAKQPSAVRVAFNFPNSSPKNSSHKGAQSCSAAYTWLCMPF